MTTRRAPEKIVERECDAALAALGFDVTRFSQPRRTMQTEGIPDRYIRSRRFGIRLWVEYKAPGGRVSVEQRAWHHMELASDGDVITVWGVSDLLRELKARGVPIEGNV